MTHKTAIESQIGRNSWLTAIGVGIVVVYGLFLLLYRLDQYPVYPFDEGAFLKVAKNYAIRGVYADFSSEGDRYIGAVVSTGPTVILPVAVLYKLFGVSIGLGRLVAVSYACLMLAALYALTANLADRRLAAVVVLLTWLQPSTDITVFGRSVLGELPGLFFVLAALWLWLKPGRRTFPDLVAVGVLFGLACMTKNQLAVFVLPGLLAAWILDLIWYRQRNWLFFVVPGVIAGLMYAGWTYYVLFLLGAQSRDVAHDLELLRSLSGKSLLVLDSTAMNNNLEYLIVMNPLFVPALLHGLTTFLHKDAKTQAWNIVFVFLVISNVMFILSAGLPRYAIACQVFNMIFSARLVYALTNGFRLNWVELRGTLRGATPSLQLLVSVTVIALLVSVNVRPFYTQLKKVATDGSDAFYRLADYLNQNVPQDKVISTWDTTLGVITNHNYSFPPQVVQAITADDIPGAKTAHPPDFHAWGIPDYVVVGPHSAHLYPPEYLTDYSLIYSAGDYHLYRRTGATF